MGTGIPMYTRYTMDNHNKMYTIYEQTIRTNELTAFDGCDQYRDVVGVVMKWEVYPYRVEIKMNENN